MMGALNFRRRDSFSVTGMRQSVDRLLGRGFKGPAGVMFFALGLVSAKTSLYESESDVDNFFVSTF